MSTVSKSTEDQDSTINLSIRKAFVEAHVMLNVGRLVDACMEKGVCSWEDIRSNMPKKRKYADNQWLFKLINDTAEGYDAELYRIDEDGELEKEYTLNHVNAGEMIAAGVDFREGTDVLDHLDEYWDAVITPEESFDDLDFEMVDDEEQGRTEVMEWWLVTDDFFKMLQERGDEALLEIEELNLWGRGATGQYIYMDGLIGEICEERELLVGQRKEHIYNPKN